MSVNIPQAQLEEIVEDAIDDIEDTVASQVCDVRTPTGGTTGEIGYKNIKSELANPGRGKDVPRGAETQGTTIEYDSFTYRVYKQVGRSIVTIEDEMDADEYAIDAVEDAASQAVEESYANVEDKFDDFLTGSQMTDASGTKLAAWDDGGSTSEPYNTIGDICRNGLDPDTAVVGGQTVEILRSHPDTKEQVSYYTGTGKVGYDTVMDAIQMAYKSIDRVIMFDKLYDTAAAGLAYSDDYFFSKSIWLGHQDRTFMIDPDHENNPKEEQEERASDFTTEIAFARFVDFQHPISELGRYIADVTA